MPLTSFAVMELHPGCHPVAPARTSCGFAAWLQLVPQGGPSAALKSRDKHSCSGDELHHFSAQDQRLLFEVLTALLLSILGRAALTDYVAAPLLPSCFLHFPELVQTQRWVSGQPLATCALHSRWCRQERHSGVSLPGAWSRGMPPALQDHAWGEGSQRLAGVRAAGPRCSRARAPLGSSSAGCAGAQGSAAGRLAARGCPWAGHVFTQRVGNHRTAPASSADCWPAPLPQRLQPCWAVPWVSVTTCP